MKTRILATLVLAIGLLNYASCERHDFENQEVKSGDKVHPGPGGKPQVIPGTSSLFKRHGHGDSHDGEKKADH